MMRHATTTVTSSLLLTAATILIGSCHLPLVCFISKVEAFSPPPAAALSPVKRCCKIDTGGEASSRRNRVLVLYSQTDDDSEAKFGWKQRIESIKVLVVGAVVASLAAAPVIAIVRSTLPTWEWTTDMAAVQGGFFALVYRYSVRMDSSMNPQLGQGVTGAFIIVRTLAAVRLPVEKCTALPLNCGGPIGYIFDVAVVSQLVGYGVESAALFGVTAVALEYAMDKKLISRFP